MKEMGFCNFESLCSYNNFVSSWYAFRDLLDVDFEEGFVCEECGSNPKIIVCDGTSLGFKRSLLMSTLSMVSEQAVPVKRTRYCF